MRNIILNFPIHRNVESDIKFIKVDIEVLEVKPAKYLNN